MYKLLQLIPRVKLKFLNNQKSSQGTIDTIPCQKNVTIIKVNYNQPMIKMD